MSSVPPLNVALETVYQLAPGIKEKTCWELQSHVTHPLEGSVYEQPWGHASFCAQGGMRPAGDWRETPLCQLRSLTSWLTASQPLECHGDAPGHLAGTLHNEGNVWIKMTCQQHGEPCRRSGNGKEGRAPNAFSCRRLHAKIWCSWPLCWGRTGAPLWHTERRSSARVNPSAQYRGSSRKAQGCAIKKCTLFKNHTIQL